MSGVLGAIGGVRRREWPFAALMFTDVLLVIASFWILKPLKKGLFIEHYDVAGFLWLGHRFTAAEAELLAKVGNMGVAVVAVWVFTWLARRVRRERLTIVLMAAFVAADVAFARVVDRPGSATVWAFYWYGDAFSTLMVAAFWAFLNDSVSREAAGRLYGFVGLGAVLGGVVGSSVLATLVHRLDASSWLLVCAAAGVVVMLVALAAGRCVPDAPARPPADAAPRNARIRSAALDGASRVARSPYLRSIAALVALYEIVSTIMDFQFTTTVARTLHGDQIRAHLSHVFALTNVASLLVQTFVTSAVMETWGVGLALLVLPAAVGAGSLAFLAVPSLTTASLLNTADNAFSYSINQSAREALYVATDPADRYAAKAFVDMFVQRAAKTAAVGLGLALDAWWDVRWASIPTLALVVAWWIAARFAGRRWDVPAAVRTGGGRIGWKATATTARR